MPQSRIIAKRFFSALENIKYGSLTLTDPEGKVHMFKGPYPGPDARLVLHDWTVITMLAVKGEVGFAQAYREARWDSADLESLFLFAMKNDAPLKRYFHGSTLSRLAGRLLYLTRQNSPRGSRRNIRAHYDLGNEFYRLWLDETMTYSSAIFSTEVAQEPLELAQYRKYDRLFDRLDGRGERILEIGCGWGGFAERALQRGTKELLGVTLSTEQQAYARERLSQKAQIDLVDYRSLAGSYDAIVSIEMFEAVGEKYWDIYFAQLQRLLRPEGRAVIQSILIDDRHFESYRSGTDVIRTYIFPGGMLPSLERFTQQATLRGLEVVDSFLFGLHYAETLRRWLKRFEEQREAMTALGFDDGFIRLWRFYLASCAAGFVDGRINVGQFELRHAA